LAENVTMAETNICESQACNQCGSRESQLLFVKQGYRLVACTRCALAYIDNPPTAEALARHYSAAAGYHDALRDPQSRAYAEMAGVARQHLKVVTRSARGGRLLDVGCSTGLFLDEARNIGFDVCGIEFSAASAEFARNRFGVDVMTGAIADADFARESFDVVTMFDVIEHVPDPSADMSTAFNLLKPGGLFIVSTPDIDGLFPRASYTVAHMIDHWPHAEPPSHLFQFSKKTLAAMLRKTGFEPGAVTDTHMPLAYSFGSLTTLARAPKMLVYAAVFAPLERDDIRMERILS
jgi:2-polyprenyl-3-methyl-5-hydroxy-6-metoxy-1,4-benzoquinol methylase